MNPILNAEKTPDKLAIIMAETGETRTYAELSARLQEIASLFTSLGLKRGDHIALVIENRVEFLEICWAAQLSGLYYTPISTHLKAAEIEYIVSDCGARLLVTTDKYVGLIEGWPTRNDKLENVLVLGDAPAGTLSFDEAIKPHLGARLSQVIEGCDMLYSSGTTGQPKGVKRPLPPLDQVGGGPMGQLSSKMFGYDSSTVYLSTAPLYHAAPLRSNITVMRQGGTSIVMRKFDAQTCLQLIEAHGVTHVQFVPTMFVRLLQLAESVRSSHDCSSLKAAIHAAAPCPVHVKEAMIDWWGPILIEYYGGTEGNGICSISSEEWLTHKGSVGRSLLCDMVILDDDGNELPAGESGGVYFKGGPQFQYHNDPEKTAKAYAYEGCSTLGDVGYQDEDGYLYLVDRKSFTIISGGVNIYPQEVENILLLHPDVLDAAVFGVPNEEFGEEVKAVIQLRDGSEPDVAKAEELIAYCRGELSSIKTPRSVDFIGEMPRSPTGKLLKKDLRTQYWPSQGRS